MTYRYFLLSLVCLSLVTVAASATSIPEAKPIQELTDVKPTQAVFKDAGRSKPLVLRKQEDLAKYFAKDELEKITAKVDLKNQVVLVFAWRGSGGDRLSYDVLESFPEQIVFRIKPGRTKDLRRHVRLFALRSNVKWSVK